MSKTSPAKYEDLTVANATLDAAEDRIEELQAQLTAATERAERAEASEKQWEGWQKAEARGCDRLQKERDAAKRERDAYREALEEIAASARAPALRIARAALASSSEPSGGENG